MEQYQTITHPEWWYHALAIELGHPGFVTLEEIVRAESEET